MLERMGVRLIVRHLRDLRMCDLVIGTIPRGKKAVCYVQRRVVVGSGFYIVGRRKEVRKLGRSSSRFLSLR